MPRLSASIFLSLVADIPFESAQMTYRETLENGFQYAYQVILLGPGGEEGEKSNIVEFLHD